MEKQKKLFPGTEQLSEFRFEIERDERRGRVRMRDGGDEWVFTLHNGDLVETWKPARELPAERYSAMRRQAAAILRDMFRERENNPDTQTDIDFSGRE